jgi:MoxR-like ATPase
MQQRFEGTSTYIATEDLQVAVNAAIRLERPLLVKGEPGTGKTILAQEVADSLGMTLVPWHIKSTTKAQQGLYEYDAVARLRDSQLGSEKVHDISNYIVRGKMWEAFEAEKPTVLLIDEIDKADIEFPNDLLLELDRMEFHVYETQQTIKAKRRPAVIHYIQFPDEATMASIVAAHYPDLKKGLVNEALSIFYGLREVSGLKKKPSTSELLDWIRLLVIEDVAPADLEAAREADEVPEFIGSMVKNEQDMARVAEFFGLRRRRRR